MSRILFLPLLLSSIFCFGQKKDNQWTPENIINTEYVRSPVFSPDGSLVVWSKSVPNKEKDKFVNRLYLTRLNQQKGDLPLTTALTNKTDSDYNAVFSEDGETIYFLSDRDKGKKLWKISIYGGEAEEVHEFENGISDLKRLRKGVFTFQSKEDETLYEKETEKDNTVVVEDEDHWKITRIYTFDTSDKSIERLTENEYPVSTYTVSSDGKYILTGHLMSLSYASDAQKKPKFYLHNLADGTKQEILQGIQEPGSFEFDHTNQGFYFANGMSSDPEWNGAGISLLNYFDLNSMQSSSIDLDWENGLSRGFDVVKGGVIASLANGPTNKLAYYEKNNSSWRKREIALSPMDQHISISGVSPNKQKIIYVHSTASQLPEYYVADIYYKKGLNLANAKKFTTLNESLKKKVIAKSEIVEWTGANGDKVSGILYYPKNYKDGEKYPLILSIHGGPSGVDMDSWSERWSTYPQILTQKGAFVLKPNYHGSSNYGLAFVESIKKNYYDLEMVDIINGIKALDEKAMIDMDMLGTMGWSNGAILTTMLTVRYPEMFKVAAPGAGDVNWTSDFGTCRFGVSFDQSYFGGAPWDDVDGQNYNPVYIEKSPLFEMDKVKTPTIIFHGSEDRAVPRDQGWEYYRALQQIAQAPVKFLWFPGQPHGLRKITHQLRKMNEEIAWFDKYLFNKDEEKNEAFKKDSPLAYELHKDTLSITQNAFGKEIDNKLIPQTVELGKDTIAISIFEVTNAQYAASSPAFSYQAGKGDYPATGLSKEDILSYVSWLNSTTDQVYRLPNKKEAKSLNEAAIKSYKGQNNLNYWAGYDITWDEISDFKLKLQELKRDLIEPIDNRKPIKVSGKYIYGLGGNVAEYYIDEGELKVYDFSAFDYVDPINPELIKESRITGFRVIKEN